MSILKKITFTILSFTFLLSCGRTPSKERVETVADIKIPSSITVTLDEFHEMGPDYYLEYGFQMDSFSLAKLVRSIKDSKFYSGQQYDDTIYSFDKGIAVREVSAGPNPIWHRTMDGFLFTKEYQRISYIVEVDSIGRKVIYREGHD